MVVAAFSQIGGTGKELRAGLARGPGPLKAPQPQDRGHTRLMGGRAGARRPGLQLAHRTRTRTTTSGIRCDSAGAQPADVCARHVHDHRHHDDVPLAFRIATNITKLPELVRLLTPICPSALCRDLFVGRMRTAAALYLSALRLKSSACVWSRHAQASSSQKRAWACRASTMWQRSKSEWYGMRDLLFSAKRASSVCEGQARNNFLRI